IGILSGLSTVVQLRAPVVFRGRILSLYFVALGVLYPVGSLLQGTVADVIGLQSTTVVFALALVGLVVAVELLAPQVPAVLDDVPVLDSGPVTPDPSEDQIIEPAAIPLDG
ncbi:MAG: MFS transporter, partial [Actinobacteria bacterium]|nr:MFS transporter [Actinomycetota bacterium]